MPLKSSPSAARFLAASMMALILLAAATGQAQSPASSGTATPVTATAGETPAPAPNSSWLGPGWVKPDDQLVDPTSEFFACMIGGGLGAMTVAIYPMSRWAYYAGALVSTMTIFMRGGLGCYAGMVAVGLYSGTRTVIHRTETMVQNLF